MGRRRSIQAFAAASAVLVLFVMLMSAASGNRIGDVFGGVFAPIFAYEPPLASVGGVKLYRRDIHMFRLAAELYGLSGENQAGSDYSDGETLTALIDQTLLAASASENGVSPDSASTEGALEPLYGALATEEGAALREAYKSEFARSDKTFDSDLRGAVNRSLTIRVFLLSLYYTASAQGMVSPELGEEEAVQTLREKLLIKLRVETDIKIYNNE